MDYESRLSISYYREVAVINQDHHIFLVQHIESRKFYVKKILDVYNINIYRQLKAAPIKGMPRIYALHEEDSKLTIIEEYVSGETLEEYLHSHGTLSDEAASNYIIQLCNILSQLHQLPTPIIHRDIKPSNIMVTSFGNIVLLDLNTAKYMDSSKPADTMLLGTKGFAAPEQYGFGSSSIQTDIYGLGVLFNILLTEELPTTHLTNGRFEPIVNKCIQLRPEDRYDSIETFKEAILKTELKASLKDRRNMQKKNSVIPPGFRNKNTLHMIIAILGYSLILWFGSTLIIENSTPAILLIDRIFVTLSFILIVFFSFNYLNIHDYLPFCKHTNKLVRNIAIIIYDFLIFATMLVLMVIIEFIIV